MQGESLLWTNRTFRGKRERVLNLFMAPYSGISNRIKNIISYLHLFYDKGKHTIDLHWNLWDGVLSRFYDLFDISLWDKKINEINHDIYIDNKYYEGATWALLLKEREIEKIGRRYIDFEYNNTPKLAQCIFKPYFQTLKPSREVRRIINQVEIPENCISVHIRHNDVWKLWGRWLEGDIEDFIAKMDSCDKSSKFFLACADIKILDIMKQTFGDRIISISNKEKERKDNIQDVAELFLLSKGKDLIATFGSTYSEVAWWLSGCKQKVTVAGGCWENDLYK